MRVKSHYLEQAMNYNLIEGNCLAVLPTLAAKSVQCVVTSPPYYGLRDYGNDEQIGLEETPDEYIANMVAVFREVRRVLREDGVVWLNLGDSFGGKQLIGIPWRVAFALQADGWYLRSDIIWHKPNPMPESVTDRCTKSHEYVFMLTKSARYYYDNEAVKENNANHGARDFAKKRSWKERPNNGATGTTGGYRMGSVESGRNRRDVWTIEEDEYQQFLQWKAERAAEKPDVWNVATKPYSGAHFAVMPPALVEPCILAGSAKGNTILDPFMGSGTVGEVAARYGRNFIGIELNPAYLELARVRVRNPYNDFVPTAKEKASPQLSLFGGDA